MDQTANNFPTEASNGRNWIGRIIIAVIVGEAIWGLIVSVMNNLVVPWLGDVMGQSSGLPTSFTQRPYNYPDLFISVLEFGIAGLVAAVLNYFWRPRAGRVAAKAKPRQSSVPIAPVAPARVSVQPAMTAAPPSVAPVQAPLTQAPPPVNPPAPVGKPQPLTPPAPVEIGPAAPATPLAPVARPATVPPPTPAVVNPVAPRPSSKAEPPKPESPNPKKPKDVYYNIVGEPMPSDDD